MNRYKIAARSGLAAAGALTLLSASACSGGAPQQGSAESGSTMRIAGDKGSPTFKRNFNPFSSNKRHATNYIYEPLEVVNTLDGKETPFLATGHKAPNPKTLVYTIRKGVKWSDGKKFTPQDVKYTFRLIKKNSALDTLGVWQHLSSIDVDGNKVTFHLKSPDVPAAYTIEKQTIVPKHVWKDVKNPVKYKNPDPVGTGPYTLGKFSPNQYTLTKNKKYWQADKVAADNLVFPNASGAVDIVKSDPGYDWAYAFVSDVKKTWVKPEPKHHRYWYPPGGTIALLPNLTKKPFNDVNFRQGLSHALDRSVIADHAEQGTVDAAGMSGLLLPNQKQWLDPDLPNHGKIEQDTKKALMYFKKAGYTKSDGKMVGSDGKQLSITITVPHGYNDWLRGVETVQKQLKSIGIKVDLNQPQQAGFTKALNNGDFDMIMNAFGGSGQIYQDFNNLLNSAFAKPVDTETTANFERFKSERADSLLKKLRRATDTGAKKKIAHELEQIVYRQAPVIGLFYGGLWGLFSDENFTGFPSEKNPYAPPTPYTDAGLLIVTHVEKAS